MSEDFQIFRCASSPEFCPPNELETCFRTARKLRDSSSPVENLAEEFGTKLSLLRHHFASERFILLKIVSALLSIFVVRFHDIPWTQRHKDSKIALAMCRSEFDTNGDGFVEPKEWLSRVMGKNIDLPAHHLFQVQNHSSACFALPRVHSASLL